MLNSVKFGTKVNKYLKYLKLGTEYLNSNGNSKFLDDKNYRNKWQVNST